MDRPLKGGKGEKTMWICQIAEDPSRNGNEWSGGGRYREVIGDKI